MVYDCLKTLEPAGFFRWFGRIAAIPHGSRKEEKLTAFLEDFARTRGLACRKDGVGNLLMTVPATPGYEQAPAVLFQAHMDMIWQTEPGFSCDFETQPLDLYVEGDRLRARGTTLGADNAVGMATMLALADDGTIPHPALELLFTVCEEAGMVGIRAVDPSWIHARRMINMDCGDSHVLCVSSAGKNDLTVQKAFSTELPQAPAWEVRLQGGLGGHPGLSANLGRCCCAHAMGQLLCGLEEFRLCALEGTGAIMAGATALLCAEDPREALEARFRLLKQVYAQTDPELMLTVTPAGPQKALSTQASAQVAKCLAWLPSGQIRCDGNDPKSIVTSGTVTGLTLREGQFTLHYRLRSTMAADSDLQLEVFAQQLETLDLAIASVDSYAGWTERRESPFRDLFQAHHRRLFGRELELERCPGGIETGILLQKLPDMDAIGLAPTARGAHTPQEHLLISQVMPYWQLLLAVLADGN